METGISRILVLVPPIPSLSKKIRSVFQCYEEVETPWFSGYAWKWSVWYGFDDSLRFQNLQIKRMIEEYDEKMEVNEWIDEENYEWMDVVKDSGELFHSDYWNGNANVNVFEDVIRIEIGDKRAKEIMFTNIPELMKQEYKDAWPIFKILCRRGFFEMVRRKEMLYERVGFRV